MTPDDILRKAALHRTRQPLNAIGRARLYALLLMDLWKTDERAPREFKPIEECENDQAYYAQVVELRPPRGKGDLLLTTLGFTQRMTFSLYRRVLGLPFEVWQRADDENWSLRQLLGVDESETSLASEVSPKTQKAAKPKLERLISPKFDKTFVGLQGEYSRLKPQKRSQALDYLQRWLDEERRRL